MHTCALTSEGGVQCWGRNDSGQLGDGTTAHSDVPVQVVGLESGVVGVAGGAVHTCAVTSEGGVQCWGDNASGQLGDGTTVDSSVPVQVVGLESGVAEVTGGFHHSCALTTAGTVKCWGTNGFGELGDGTATQSATPVDVLVEPGGAPLSGAAHVSAGAGFHTCALMEAGGLECWGRNTDGQLGCGSSCTNPIVQDVVGLGSGVAAVEAGENHACALTTDGGVKCWGRNFDGQLGDGTTIDRSTPVDVVGLESGVAAIGGGGLNSCAITDAGGAKCWGFNFFGNVGDGTTVNRTTPVDVVGLGSGVAQIDPAVIHTCALTTSGAVTCWGDNVYGQVGDADGDGCTDFAEHGSDPASGGQRDAFNYWDFRDVPAGTPAERNGMIFGEDIAAMVPRFGATDDGGSAAINRDSDPVTTEVPPPPGYHPAFDAQGALMSGVTPPDGGIFGADIGAVVMQFGDSCV